MNEKEKILTTRIMSEVMDMQLSKYQSLFLYQLALIRKKDKDESLDESICKVMKKMQELCKRTKGLEHKKNIVETSTEKCRRKLDEELSDAKLDDNFFRGDVVINVIDYLIRE